MSMKDIADQVGAMAQIKVESVAPFFSYLTNGFVFAWGAITFNQVMMLIGTIFAVATYFTSLHFQRRRDRRESEFHKHRIAVEMSSAEKAADRAEIKDWRDEDKP